MEKFSPIHANLQEKTAFCLISVSVPSPEFEFKYFSREHAAEHIAVLVEADKRGHYSHGFNRLDIYYNDIAK